MKNRSLVLSLLLIGSAFLTMGSMSFTASAQTVLADDTPMTFPAPAPSDDFEFSVLNVDHSVIGIRSPGGTGHLLEVYEDNTMSAWVEDDLRIGGVALIGLNKTDWVSPPNRGVQVSASVGPGNYIIEMENDLNDYSVMNSWAGYMESTPGGVEVLDAFELYGATVGNSYTLDLNVPSTMDLDMYLYDFMGDNAMDPPDGWQSINAGAGVDESITFTASITGDYLLVITNENGGTGGYSIGYCTSLSTLNNNYPVTCPTPPPAMHDFEFYASVGDHTAIGIRPPAGNSYRINVYDDNTMTTFIENDLQAAGNPVPFVGLDMSVWGGMPNRGAQIESLGGTGDYVIEMEYSHPDIAVTGGYVGTMDIIGGGIEVLDAYDLSGITAASTYTIDLAVPPTMDLDMWLFDFNGDDAQDPPDGWSSQNVGAGVDESITFTAAVSTTHLLTILNIDGGTGTYVINYCSQLATLNDDQVVTCPTPSPDLFDFSVLSFDHAAVGIRSPTGADYDFRVYTDNTMGSQIEYVWGEWDGDVDFIALNKTDWTSPPNRGAQAEVWSGSGDYQIEMENDIGDLSITYGTTWTGDMTLQPGGYEVLDAFELTGVVANRNYTITLEVPPTADMDLFLFDFMGDNAQDSDVPPWSSETTGLGLNESITFTSITSDDHLLVVTNKDTGEGPYRISAGPSRPPVLDWTGEPNYVNDGLDPETGGPTTTFTYRVQYSDANNQPPISGPSVHILQGGMDIPGSPFAMTFDSWVGAPNNYLNGAIYTYSTTLSTLATDYTYYFEAADAEFDAVSPISVGVYDHGTTADISYFIGANANQFIRFNNALITDPEHRFYPIITDILTVGTLSTLDVLLLPDNAVPDADLVAVGNFFNASNGIVTVDSAVTYAAYSGFLWPAAAGTNGWTTYWDYTSGANDQEIILAHPITEDYTVGQIVSSIPGDVEMFNAMLPPDATALTAQTTSLSDIYVAIREDATGGRIVELGPFGTGGSLPVDLLDMIRDAVYWAAGEPQIPTLEIDAPDVLIATLTVTDTPIAFGSRPQGATDVVMEQLTLSASSSTITVTDIQVDQTGTGADADTGNIYLYDDVNDDGILDLPGDILLDTQIFAGGTLTFTGLTFNVVSGTNERLLIVFDIAAGATVGNTLIATLVDETYVTITAPSIVAPFGPINSNTITIGAIPTVPANVAIFKDQDPWSYTSNEDILNIYSIPYTVYNLGDIGVVSLAPFDKVIIASNQPFAFYTAVEANTAWFESYVDAGGILQINAAENVGWPTGNLPGGYVYVSGGGDTVGILAPGNDMLNIPSVITLGELQGWTSSYHGYFSTTPAGATLVLDDTGGNVILADSISVCGSYIMSSQTLEWGYDHHYSPILENIILYMPPSPCDTLTVTGTPIASGTVSPGQTNVVMEQLTLSASSGTITVTDIQVDQTGTGADADTGSIYLYDDINDNGILDGDTLLDTQTFTAGTLTFTGLTFNVVSGTDEHLLIVFDIAAGATLGNTLRATLVDNSYVSVTAPDLVAGFATIDSNVVTIALPADILTVTGTPITSGAVNPGDTNVVMEQLTLTASANTIDVTAIRVDQTGTGVDADTGNIHLYDDANDDGNLDAGDLLLDTRTFSGGTLTFSGFTFTVTSGTPENLLIVFDIAAGATPTNTLRATLVDNTYITVTAPDSVAPFATINSNLVTIAADTLTVKGVALVSGTIAPGTSNVVMMQLNLSAGSGTITVTDIRISQVGTGVDADTGNVDLYDDANGDGALDAGDTLEDTATFINGSLNFTGLGYNVVSGTNRYLLIVFDIASGATDGNTLRFQLNNSAYINVTAPDGVSSANFPINSNTITISTAGPPPDQSDIDGKVLDPAGNPIQGATVKLFDEDGNQKGSTTTDADGKFKFQNIEHAKYTIQISATGYETYTVPEFTLNQDHTVPDVTMTAAQPPVEKGFLEEYWWIIVVIVVIIVVLLLLVLLMRRRKKPAEGPTAVEMPPEGVPPEGPPPEAPAGVPPEAPPEGPPPPPEPGTPPPPTPEPESPPPPPPP